MSFLQKSAQNSTYYLRSEGYKNEFLDINEIYSFYSKFTENALLKLVKEDAISDQDGISFSDVKN